MKVLFIEIEMERNWSVAALGPAFLSNFVRPHGHQCSIVHIAFDCDLSDAIQQIISHNPDVFALSLTTRQWLRAKQLLGMLRDVMDRPTIVGGLHPTFSPEHTIAQKGIDFLCLGEGEESFLDFLNHLAALKPIHDGSIKNIWVKDGTRPSLRPPYPDLNALPYMDRALLNERYGVVNMTTQRGCPFPCTYCAARMYNEM